MYIIFVANHVKRKPWKFEAVTNMAIANYKVYAYIAKHHYILGGMLFTICKAQLHVSATNVGHLQVVR
jgi:hypothetical protein